MWIGLTPTGCAVVGRFVMYGDLPMIVVHDRWAGDMMYYVVEYKEIK